MSTASVKSRRSNSSFDLKRLLTLKFAASCSAAEAIPYSQTDDAAVKDYHPPRGVGPKNSRSGSFGEGHGARPSRRKIPVVRSTRFQEFFAPPSRGGWNRS